jgi:hypothetical protein
MQVHQIMHCNPEEAHAQKMIVRLICVGNVDYPVAYMDNDVLGLPPTPPSLEQQLEMGATAIKAAAMGVTSTANEDATTTSVGPISNDNNDHMLA